jgi:hypothetical protein
MLLVAASPAAPASAQDTQDELPSVLLEAPAQARRPAVRVLVQIRDCSTRPTVTVVGSWRRARGRAVLQVSGIDRVLRRSPRRATRRTDRITFPRVRPRRRVARVRAGLITNWRAAKQGASRCEVRLPTLIGSGALASAARTGIVRLRTPLEVASTIPPQRGTATDHIWACGGARRGDFKCGLTATIGSAVANPVPTDVSEEPEDSEDSESDPPKAGEGNGGDEPGPPDWLAALIAAGSALVLGGAGLARTPGSPEPTDTPETWDELARKEYGKPDEPISARASDLSKIGAPVAAFATAILAVSGGWVVDASADIRMIAAAVVVAVAVGGLFYVFANDFRSRAAVSVARFNDLCTHSQAEAKATEKVKAEAGEAKAQAKKAEAEAKKAREAMEAAAAEHLKLVAEAATLKERLRQCEEQAQPPGSGTPAPPPAPPPAVFLTLEGVPARTGGAPTTLYGVESAGGSVVRYLVSTPSGKLTWIPEAEVSHVGEA